MNDRKPCMILWLLFLLLLPQTVDSAETVWLNTFEDIHGKQHTVLNPPRDEVSVVVFITTDCPIANSYQPTLSRMAEQFSGQGVSFYLVHPSSRVTARAAKKHAEDFQLDSPIILDHSQVIAKHLSAKVTPEAFVIDDTGKTRYRGRIDNLYAGFGKKRRQPTQHDLRDAITATLSDQSTVMRKTDAIGCRITYATSVNSAQPFVPSTPTVSQ